MKKIMFGAISFVLFFALVLQSVPAHAQTASALTPQETAVLKQSLDILGTIVNSLQAQAGTTSPENREKILVTLVSVKSSLVQINGTLAGLAPHSQTVVKKIEVSQPTALKQAPIAAPAPQASVQPPVAAVKPQANTKPFVSAGLQPSAETQNIPVAETAPAPAQNAPENNLASTGATLDPRNIWWPSLVIAALGLALFLYLQKRDAGKGNTPSETNPVITA